MNARHARREYLPPGQNISLPSVNFATAGTVGDISASKRTAAMSGSPSGSRTERRVLCTSQPSAQKLLEVNYITFRAGNDNSKNNRQGRTGPTDSAIYRPFERE